MQARTLFAIALLSAEAAAISSKFTKILGPNGSYKNYFDLSEESSSVLQTAEGRFFVPLKL